jgi:hypothetical protein
MSKLNQMNRLHQILFILLIIQIGLGALVYWPSSAASQVGGPLLANIAADKVTEVIIQDGDGNRIALAKKSTGWVLPEAGDFPVTQENITTLLEKVEAIKNNRLVTQTESSHKRLQVADDDFNRRIDLSFSDGTQHTLFVGSSGGASATHVRADGQPEVYLTSDIGAFDVNARASSWIETLYFTLPQTATTHLTLENGNGVFEFTRGEAESWTFAGLGEAEILNQGAVTSLVNQVSSIRMTEPIGTEEQPSFGLSEPLATVTLETAEESYTLLVGAKDAEDNSYILKASNSPYYVRVAAFTGDNLVNKTRPDFLEAPPTPEAEATSESDDSSASESE